MRWGVESDCPAALHCRSLPWAHNFFLDTLSSAWHKQCMYQQHCIRETLTSEAGAARVAALMAGERFPSRTAAGRRVCEAFGFRDARGGLQQAGCVKALRVLEAAGRIALPEPLNRGGGRPPRDLGEAIPAGGGGTGAGGGGGGTEAGSGEGAGGAASVEWADGTGASARGGAACGGTVTLSDRLGAWDSGRDGLCGLGAGAGGAGPVDGLGGERLGSGSCTGWWG